MEMKCSAHRSDGLCSNGFPQNAGCLGIECHACGKPSDKVPPCQDESLGLPWINPDTGAPIHYRPACD